MPSHYSWVIQRTRCVCVCKWLGSVWEWEKEIFTTCLSAYCAKIPCVLNFTWVSLQSSSFKRCQAEIWKQSGAVPRWWDPPRGLAGPEQTWQQRTGSVSASRAGSPSRVEAVAPLESVTSSVLSLPGSWSAPSCSQSRPHSDLLTMF